MASPTHTRDLPTAERYDLTRLSDNEVLVGTRRLVGASNQILADLLAHLAEVEARGIHRVKACASLYTYCIYELQFSEDAAFRRVSAARFVKTFPALFDAVANGELHLTGLLMIAPHLTPSNQHDVLARARHRTKKELAKLVRELDPLPDVPARIAPLGPAAPPRNPLRNPTWAEYVASMEPVRDLKPGERPRDWIDEPTIAKAFEQSTQASEQAANGGLNTAPARNQAVVTGPQRHSVQFTASQEYVNLVERAKALLSHTGGTALEELHLRAMQCLVGQLERRKYGAPKRVTSEPTVSHASTGQAATGQAATGQAATAQAATGQAATGQAREQLASESSAMMGVAFAGRCPEPGQVVGSDNSKRPSVGAGLQPRGTVDDVGMGDSASPTELSRNIPARIRRRVFERDEARCTFVDDRGCRCREVERLELHHLKPFARAGQHHADNLTLRCRAHNALAAEQDFGREWIIEKRGAALHDSLHLQRRSQ